MAASVTTPTPASSLAAEVETLTQPFVASGEFSSTSEVLHAAMNALRAELRQKAFDEACVRAAEEGEASGLAEGDVIARVREKHGLRPSKIFG